MLNKLLTVLIFIIESYKAWKLNRVRDEHEKNIDTGVSNVTGGVQYPSREEMLAARSKKTNN